MNMIMSLYFVGDHLVEAFDIDADLRVTCPHHYYAQVSSPVNITAQPYIYKEIIANHSDLYYFEDSKLIANVARKILIKLEPCSGIVYVLVRRTYPCWPNPYRCESKKTPSCEWAHYQSDMSPSRTGNQTLIEVPLSSTRWYITVFAQSDATYSLSIINNPSAYPRVGSDGVLRWAQILEDTITLSWSPASVSTQYQITRYIIYNSISLDDVAVTPHTVCGLRDHSDFAYKIVHCQPDATMECSTNISHILQNQTYAMNVVAESSSGLMAAYSGVVARSKWDKTDSQVYDDVAMISCITGATLLSLIIGTHYFLTYKYL